MKPVLKKHNPTKFKHLTPQQKVSHNFHRLRRRLIREGISQEEATEETQTLWPALTYNEKRNGHFKRVLKLPEFESAESIEYDAFGTMFYVRKKIAPPKPKAVSSEQ